jgi:eukaryotic-like serine/threonine-protein kinase
MRLEAWLRRALGHQPGAPVPSQGPEQHQSGLLPTPAVEPGQPRGTIFIGRYQVVEDIGVGSTASVFLARMDGPSGFQKWVAIKCLHPHLAEDGEAVDMFLDEARIAAGIRHANVVQVFELGKDDNVYWIVMEYVRGELLREVSRCAQERGLRLTSELAAQICSEAAEGLYAVHDLHGRKGPLSLVHRDVTPHNLFLTYDGHTKLFDFGTVKVADRPSSTRAGTLKGTLAYMSPEQVRGAEVDCTTDIFALGVVLWELSTNQRLFRMDTDLDTLERVHACVVPPPSSIVADYPIELEGIVMKALAKHRQDRFQTARELADALRQFLVRNAAAAGPEEVAQFVHQVFAERIRNREAHLARVAEEAPKINVDTLPGGARR